MLTPDDVEILRQLVNPVIDAIAYLSGIVTAHIVATVFRIY